MRRMRSLLTLLVASLLLFGCVESNPKENIIAGKEFTVQYKQTAWSPRGKMTAWVDDAIYYLGSGDGGQGIYRMGSDGDGEQFIIQIQDVRRMQIMDDSLYYVGYAGKTTNHNGEIALFRPYCYNAKHGQRSDILEQVDIDDDARLRTIWDLYIDEQGNYFFTRLVPAWPQSKLELSFFGVSNEHKMTKAEYKKIADVDAGDCVNKAGFTLCKRGSGYLCSQYLYMDGNSETLECISNPSMYSLFLGEAVFGTDVQFINRLAHRDYQDRVVRAIRENVILLTSDNEICEYVIGNAEAIAVASLPKSFEIIFAWQFDKKITLLTESMLWGQRLYEYNWDTKQLSLVYKTKFNEKIVHIEETNVITVSNKRVFMCTLQAGRLVRNREIEITSSIFNRENQIEICGEWLFVYKYNAEDEYNELIEKISLAK